MEVAMRTVLFYLPALLLFGIPVSAFLFLILALMLGPQTTRNAFRKKFNIPSLDEIRKRAEKFQ